MGVVGFGRLGRLLVGHFAKEHRIRVHDVRLDARAVRKLGAVPATLAEACAQDVIVPCVPIGELEGVLRRMRGLLRPGALVVDVCSVKERPVAAMKRWLPKGVDILGTHPNFGPDSAAESLRGRQIAVCKVRIAAERWRKVRRVLESKGLEIVEMTPREHDRRMASSLLLTHFIGRSLIDFGARSTGIDTEGYKRLLRILQTVQNDSWELFQDMNRFNAYAAPMRRDWLASMARIDRKVRR
ncbi:MAG: prephenate dehydrogenase/arogenate dehydrogenase family protein [Proteobacteria bacterium]|nr:prephenate dehydrogenase/arogenate dehydrogenase family protein [Pseudomonadota bacterium]